nr:hypothetical protein [Tanacetum cinerariifolium]
MWLFRHKYLADGTLSRYKTRLVVNGSTHLEDVDVDETFSSVVKPVTIQTVFSLVVSRHWPVHLLDVKNAFVHGDLSETRKYVVKILEKTHMVDCNSSRTLIDTESKLGADGDLISDPTLYRSLASSLQYLTFTRPDISYAIQLVCLYTHDHRGPHFSALKRILWYIHGTLKDRHPTTVVFPGNNLLSWSAKRQPMLSRSSAEAEYHGVVNAVAETCWLRNLLRELHTPLSSTTLVYYDNVNVVYLSCNPIQHQRTKHIEIDIHFFRGLVVIGQV